MAAAEAPAPPSPPVGDVEETTPFKLFVGQVRHAPEPASCDDACRRRLPELSAWLQSDHPWGSRLSRVAKALHAAGGRRRGRVGTFLTRTPPPPTQVPVTMTAEQLRPNFESFGNIEEITIIRDKSTHLSKGCGFVTFSTEDAARAAIEALSEKLVLVRPTPHACVQSEHTREREGRLAVRGASRR